MVVYQYVKMLQTIFICGLFEIILKGLKIEPADYTQ